VSHLVHLVAQDCDLINKSSAITEKADSCVGTAKFETAVVIILLTGRLSTECEIRGAVSKKRRQQNRRPSTHVHVWRINEMLLLLKL